MKRARHSRVRTHHLRTAAPLTAAWCMLAAIGCGQNVGGSPIYGHAVLSGVEDHSGITVRIIGHDAEVVTDAYGYFNLGDFPRGTFMLHAERQGTFEKSVAAEIEHDGKNPTGTFLSMSPWARVVGRVSNAQGEGLVAATVQVLGSDAGATTLEDGVFIIDPAPAGHIAITAGASRYMTVTQEVEAGVGQEVELSFSLERDPNPDPYAGNAAPTMSPITLSAEVDDRWPRPVPLVGTENDHVRRKGLYRLHVTVDDLDGDEINVFWSSDRGTLLSTWSRPVDGIAEVAWRAGSGTSTIVATAVDPRGGTAISRRVLNATGDNTRGAGVYDGIVYYGEQRSSTHNIYSYDLTTGHETTYAQGSFEQHGVQIFGDWLVFADSEFLFIGDLVYRIRGVNLATGAEHTFGQDFGHADNFRIRIDLYTPLRSTMVPILSSDPAIAPLGLGYFDLLAGRPLAATPFSSAGEAPTNLRAFTRTQTAQGDFEHFVRGDTLHEMSVTRNGAGPAVPIATLPSNDAFSVRDVQSDGDYVAVIGQNVGPLLWVNRGRDKQVNTLGARVPSFALSHGKIAYIERGPAADTVELYDLQTGVTRRLSTAPHFARRLWFMDDSWVIWGDQGVEGRSFVALNSEVLWVTPVHP